MRDIIIKKLLNLEREFGYEILYACESGSRAWGFESKDSDYDVRFVYKMPKENYLSFIKFKDTIEYELNEIYDISGWDIRKYISLMLKSNCSAFEWKNSDIIYKKSEIWDEISPKFDEFFDIKSGVYSYISMAKKDYYNHTKSLTIKKIFYILRALICALYILKYKKPPLMRFENLMAKVIEESNLNSKILDLLEMKKGLKESEFYKLDSEILDFIDDKFRQIDEILPNLQSDSKPNLSLADEMFFKVLNFKFN